MNFKKITFILAALLIICSSFYFLFFSDISGKKTVLRIVCENDNYAPLNNSFYEEAAKGFMKNNPNIVVKFISMSDYESVDYIEKGSSVDGWFVSRETNIDDLKNSYTWKEKSSNVTFDQQTFATSPLVFLGYSDKIDKLGEITISKLYDAVVNKKSWSLLNGDSDWGDIKFAHPNASIYNTGSRLLILLAQNYYLEKGIQKNYITKQDILNNKFKEYISKFERNAVEQLGDNEYAIDSMTDYNYNKYDICVFDEYTILKNISKTDTKWSGLKLSYPSPNFYINIPFVSFTRANNSLEKANALKLFKEYLLSPAVQAKVLSNGLRPVNTNISEYDLLEKQYSSFGFKKNLPPSLPYHGYDTYNALDDIVNEKK
jgi:hypothetical protein